MCLAIPYKIVKVEDKKAIVYFRKKRRELRCDLVSVKKGDWVVSQNRYIVRKLRKKEVKELLRVFK